MLYSVLCGKSFGLDVCFVTKTPSWIFREKMEDRRVKAGDERRAERGRGGGIMKSSGPLVEEATVLGSQAAQMAACWVWLRLPRLPFFTLENVWQRNLSYRHLSLQNWT